MNVLNNFSIPTHFICNLCDQRIMYGQSLASTHGNNYHWYCWTKNKDKILE